MFQSNRSSKALVIVSAHSKTSQELQSAEQRLENLLIESDLRQK